MSRPLTKIIVSTAFALAMASASQAATCITSQSGFGTYKQELAARASSSGIGQRGLQALQSAKISGITWRLESNPSSQGGVSYNDPSTFLAKRSGSSADAFIQRARSKLQQNANLFTALERKYGVPGSILVTIWGLETSWGGYLGRTPVIDGAITLASYCRRYPRFEPHAIAALQLVDMGDISSTTQGGPSGELGHMQFLAGNWLRYRVDANGDGRDDPTNAVDALATAANFLRQKGWKPGQPFGQGTANAQVLTHWNDSGNYQRAIIYSAERIGN